MPTSYATRAAGGNPPNVRPCWGAYGRCCRPASAMIRHPLLVLVLVVSLGPASRAPAQPAVNLLMNGDAESAAGSSDGNTVVPIPGWTSMHGATVVQY